MQDENNIAWSIFYFHSSIQSSSKTLHLFNCESQKSIKIPHGYIFGIFNIYYTAIMSTVEQKFDVFILANVV